MRLQNTLDLARAGHLFTKEATPKIYYRPYLLLPEQKTLIEQQIAQAQEEIDAKEQDNTAVQRRGSDVEDVAVDRLGEDEHEDHSATPGAGDEEVVMEEEEGEGDRE